MNAETTPAQEEVTPKHEDPVQMQTATDQYATLIQRLAALEEHLGLTHSSLPANKPSLALARAPRSSDILIRSQALIAERIAAVLGSDERTHEEINRALVRNGYRLNSREPRAYIAHILSRRSDLFEKGSERGYWRCLRARAPIAAQAAPQLDRPVPSEAEPTGSLIRRNSVAGRVASIIEKAGKPLRLLNVLLTMAKLLDPLVDEENAMGVLTASILQRQDIFQAGPDRTWGLHLGVTFDDSDTDECDDLFLDYLTEPRNDNSALARRML